MVWLLYGRRLTDEAIAYKVFRREVLQGLELRCVRYEFCPEFTSKVLKKGCRIYEVPIRYQGRRHSEGKKCMCS